VFSRHVFVLIVGIAAWASCSTSRCEDITEPPRAQGHTTSHIGTEGVSHDPSEIKGDLAIYTFVVFALLLGLLYKYAWGPVTEGLERRELSIRDNIAGAEAARLKAEKMLAEHAAKLDKVQDEVREILAEARRDAEYTKNGIVAAAQKEAEATRQRAVQDIERARDQALDSLFHHMARCVNEATEQVIGRALTGADNDRLIEEALSGFAQRKH
jgi:F-type H+-transporting ATPase subunit b